MTTETTQVGADESSPAPAGSEFDPATIGFVMTGKRQYSAKSESEIVMIRVTFAPTGQYVDVGFRVPNKEIVI